MNKSKRRIRLFWAIFGTAAFLIIMAGAGALYLFPPVINNQFARVKDAKTNTMKGGMSRSRSMQTYDAYAPGFEEGDMLLYAPLPATDGSGYLEILEPKSPDRSKQSITGWRRSRKLPNASRLKVGDREELPLEGMQVNVQIVGFRARVLIDYYYLNNNDRQLEGNFQLRLPSEASLYFFAFGETSYGPKQDEPLAVRGAFFNVNERTMGMKPEEIMLARSESWRAPKEARMVPREKAAFAYRQTVRRRVDPALVEWSGAGVFSARVFPLMPRKLHRIVVGYDMELAQLGDNLVYKLDLPEKLSECTVDLNVAELPGITAKVTPEVNPFTSGGHANYRFKNPKARSFEVKLSGAGNMMLEGYDPDAGPFFAASVRPELPEGKDVAGAERAVFLLDTSLSSNPEKFNVWLSLLKATLENNRDSISEFAVLMFNVETHWWKKAYAKNTPQNVAELMKYSHTLSLEGATDLGRALSEAALPKWQPQVDGRQTLRDFFLLSDGAITWGERNTNLLTRALGKAGVLFAYRTGLAGTDVRVLGHLTRETGGSVFSVVGEKQVAAASRAHRKLPWHLKSVELAGTSDLLLAGRPTTIFPGQQLTLVGRGKPAKGAKVLLALSRAGEQKKLSIALDQRVESDLAPRIYGQVAVTGLEDLGQYTDDVSTAYARHFRITGRTCSLLMLESEEDYRRFNIKPEDDAFVVKITSTDEVMKRMLDKVSQLLADPKARFVAWLERLEKLQGLEFRIQPALRMAIKSMPKSAFDVKAPPLACRERTWEGVPGALKEQLSLHKITYDKIMAEARRRREAHGSADALKALSSLVELQPGDLVLARDVGFSAIDLGLGGQAYYLLRRVAEARPYEPQTYLAIAYCLAELDKGDLAMIYYELAVNGTWDESFQDFSRIAGVDYLHFLRQVEKGKVSASQNAYALARLESMNKTISMKRSDLVVTIMWNTDGTDVDLHIYEPSGELCNYQHRQTKSGGHLTRDVTQGYGPEMYTLRNAPRGQYKIRAKYYSSDAIRMSARTRVFATIYEDWGSEAESVVRKAITLEGNKEMHNIVTVKRSGK